MAIASGDIIRAVFTWLLTNDDLAQNVFHFLVTSGSETDDADTTSTLIDWFEDALGTAPVAVVNDAELDAVDVYKWDATNDEFDPLTNETPCTFVGTDATEMMPHGISALLSRPTSDPRSTARTFLPGMSEGTQANGLWAAAHLTRLLDICDAMTDVATTTSGAVLTPGTFTLATETFNPVTGTFVVNSLPAYQRRRKPGVGA